MRRNRVLVLLALVGAVAVVGTTTLGARRAKGSGDQEEGDARSRVVGAWHMANHRTGSLANTTGVFTFYADGNFSYTFGSVINKPGLPFNGRSGGRGRWKRLPPGNGNPAATDCYEHFEGDGEIISEEVLFQDGNGAGAFLARQKFRVVGDEIQVTGKFVIDDFNGTTPLTFDNNPCTGSGVSGTVPALRDPPLLSGIVEGGGIRIADSNPLFAGFDPD
jgi:hypothetical protein